MTTFSTKLPSRKHLVYALKVALPLLIIGWLLLGVEAERWAELREQPKQWWLLAVAMVLTLVSTVISFARWYLLVRIVEIPFRLRDALRLGFLGYLLNFVSAGSVGGDFFKAFFLAKESPGRRAKAVASVLVDRVIGLYSLLLVATLGVLFTGLADRSTELSVLSRVLFSATAVGALGIFVMLVPGFTKGRLTSALARVPKLGGILLQLIHAVRMYRQRWVALGLALAMSLVVHGLLATAVFLVATSLFSEAPSLDQHVVVVPISLVAAALPISPAGLGTFEVCLEELYKIMEGSHAPPGVTVALVFRLMTIGVAAIGAIYYLACRREVREVLAEASREIESEAEAAG